MPYTVSDVDTHIKGLTPKAKRAWVAIANSALTKCVSDGGKEADCAGKAIKQASGVAGKMGEAESTERELYAALTEKGRVLSADNEKAIRTALASIQAVLAKVMVDDTTATEAALEELPDLAVALTEAELSFNDRERAIRAALKVRNPLGYCWLRDVYDADCIFEMQSGGGYDDIAAHLYRVGYTIGADGSATLGDPTEVRVETQYVPVGQAATATESEQVELNGDLVPLIEKAVRRDGTVPIVVATPGWGSSGYYSAEVLKRDGPKVFTKGLQSYFDHPSLEEEASRPERSVRDLLGVLESDARWQDEGQAGPGLYADLKVFPQHTDSLEAMAPHVGMSLRADGIAPYGEAEGKKGRVVESLVAARSVDCVTAAGRGGAILQLFEARRGRVSGGSQVDENEARTLRETAATAQTKLTEAEAKLVRLGDLETQLARMTEGLILRDARSFVAAELAGIQLPDMTRARLSESLSANPPVKDGALDLDAYRVRIKENAATELEYLAKVTGAGSGRIVGLGGGGSAVEVTAEEADKQLDQEFKKLLGESAGAQAAAGRNG